MLRLGIRDFGESFEAATAAVSGPNRELWGLRVTGWLAQDRRDVRIAGSTLFSHRMDSVKRPVALASTPAK
jgi:hypothetical protein